MLIKIEPIFGKVNEGDKIKKTLDKFLGSPMRALGRKKTYVFLVMRGLNLMHTLI